jgi:hypothetical protein
METKRYEFYEAPTTTVVELKFEGIICQSGGDPQDYSDPFSGGEETL